MCNARRIRLRREARDESSARVTQYRVSHLQRYDVTVRGNVTVWTHPNRNEYQEYFLRVKAAGAQG